MAELCQTSGYYIPESQRTPPNQVQQAQCHTKKLASHVESAARQLFRNPPKPKRLSPAKNTTTLGI